METKTEYLVTAFKLIDLSGLTHEEFFSKRRKRELADVRHVVAKILRETYPEIRLEQIGKILNRDHSTVTYYLKEIDSGCPSKFKLYLKLKSKL